MTDTLTKAGFTKLDPTIHPRLIMSISGHEKHGKTHFAMTAPGTIAYFNLDMGDEGVVHKFCNDKAILNYDIEVPKSGLKDNAIKIWDDFNKAYDIALKDARTVIIDTATELWELLRVARFGQLTQVMPYQYGPVNTEFRSVIRRAFKAVGTNVILLHKVKPVYINDKRTKDYERSGFSDTGFLVQVNATMCRLDPDPDESRENVEFSITIDDCRHNTAIMGKTFTGAMATFPMIAQLAIVGTKAENWT